MQANTHQNMSWQLKLTTIVWLTLVAFGFCSLLAFSQTPSTTSTLNRKHHETTAAWTLVIGIHPQCPCSLATISELERLHAKVNEQLRCKVYAYCPTKLSDEEQSRFLDSHLIKRAEAVPNCEIVRDRQGLEAAQRGITTSGGCVLYDRTGTPRFQGGITPSRGHEGDNLGSRSILAMIRGNDSEVTQTPVYGCLLTEVEGAYE